MVTRKEYYDNIDIMFEIIHQHKHKETFFLPFIVKDNKLESTPPIRWLNASAIKFMEMHFKRFKFMDNPMNLYHSLATYKDFPTFSYNRRQKMQEQELWSKMFHKYIAKYDLFLETDSKDLAESFADAKEIVAFLDEFKIRYSLNFSGSKGIHVNVPSEEFEFLDLPMYDREREDIGDFNEFVKGLPYDNFNEVFDQVLLFKCISYKIKTLLMLETMDTSVQDILRVKKTAYSLDVKSGLVAYPLDDRQFLGFNKDMVRPENVLRQSNHKRGMLYRNTSISGSEREKNIKNMLVELGILQDFK